MTAQSSSKTKTIMIPQPFDYNARKSFLPLFKDVSGAEVLLDFRNVDHMDSSALGMLLMAREKIDSKKITLINCTNNIKDLLKLAQFHMLFTIK